MTEDQVDELSDLLTNAMSINPELNVRRPVYQQDELHRLCKYAEPKTSLGKRVSKQCQKVELFEYLKQSIPVIGWLSAYNWKDYLLGDVVAGITVAVMHIPQGMAYAILGNVPPIVGIYMAFFPVLVYFVFGTSRHNSMGTFALICLMTGKVVTTYSTFESSTITNSTIKTHETMHQRPIYTPIEVATAVTFTVAIMQLAMYVLRLGAVISILSESLISGFTTASAIQVFTSQIKDLFGLTKMPRRNGLFSFILTYYDIFNNIDNFNITAMILSSVTIILLMFNNEILKPLISKICPFPVPIEMIIVVSGTLISTHLNLAEAYNIVTVNNIPVGFPAPTIPRFNLIPDILMDCIIITIVSYVISMSLALLFARKCGYEVDSNQELMAQGFGNLAGSFFSCMPFTASLSRSTIQETVGGHTQLTSLISCGILAFVLLWIGPFFEPLPRCILASIIVVALKGMLMKGVEFFKYWRLDKWDALIWMSTFLTALIFNIEYGLLIGVIICLSKLLMLAINPYNCQLALAPGTELFLDVKRYKGTIPIPGIKIFHYSGSLNFISQQNFRNAINKMTKLIPRPQLNNQSEDYKSNKEVELEELNKCRVLILDFTALSHVDLAGVITLRSLMEEYSNMDVTVYITGCSGPVYETIRKCSQAEYNEQYNDRFFAMFPTVADAVHFARCNGNFSIPFWSYHLPEQENSICSRL